MTKRTPNKDPGLSPSRGLPHHARMTKGIPAPTWAELVEEGAAALREGPGSGRLDPRREAEILLRHAAGMDSAALLRIRGEAATAIPIARFRAWVATRAQGVPLQHLLGEASFHGIVLRVEPGVFIPRPETETLVDAAIASVWERAAASPLREIVVLDLCTGSGTAAVAIAAALHAGAEGSSSAAASHAGRVRVFAGDVDPAAVDLARRNANACAVASIVEIRVSDLAEAFADLDGRVDVLVANPPYIDPADADSLPVEVRFGDPPRALFDSEGGVGYHRRIAREGRRLLRPDGQIFLEIGDDQGVQARRILADEGYEAIRILPDLTGRARVACGRVEPSTQSS
jgi:release factor glutamine methyltransferase